MNIYPKITIVTPNYNKAEFIESTIKSVLSQNYPNLEYIIIDGGSTDGSVEIIEKYRDKLAYFVSEPDQGMYHAIRKGFDHSSGEIMAWIGSDDMYHPMALFSVAQIFTEFPEISWLVGTQTSYDVNNKTVGTSQSPYYNRIDFLMGRYHWIQQESTFWRRSLYDKTGGVNTDYRLAGDFDLWMRFSRYEKMYITDALIGGFRHSDNQLSLNLDSYLREINTIIDREQVTNDERKKIKLLNFKLRILSYINKIRAFRCLSLDNLIWHNHIREEESHRLHFDYKRKKFVIIDN